MNFSINELANIISSTSLSSSEIRRAVKLATIDVLKVLPDNKYLINLNEKELIASSSKKLDINSKYWAQVQIKPNKLPILFKLTKYPIILKELQNLPISFDTKELHHILKDTTSFQNVKDSLLKHLALATSKHEFLNISNLLLSLTQNILTIPLQFEQTLSLFQMKKRYNKKSKKNEISFYAALSNLGPISGTIFLLQDQVIVDLKVLFDTTKLFLEKNLKKFHYKVIISVQNNITPLYTFKEDSILDVNV